MFKMGWGAESVSDSENFSDARYNSHNQPEWKVRNMVWAKRNIGYMGHETATSFIVNLNLLFQLFSKKLMFFNHYQEVKAERSHNSKKSNIKVRLTQQLTAKMLVPVNPFLRTALPRLVLHWTESNDGPCNAQIWSKTLSAFKFRPCFMATTSTMSVAMPSKRIKAGMLFSSHAGLSIFINFNYVFCASSFMKRRSVLNYGMSVRTWWSTEL